MIELQNVTKIYEDNGVCALKDVSLKIKQGEFAFIVGTSGSGKSTLLKLLLKEEDVNDEIINHLLTTPYMVEEIIKQHPIMKAIHPQSVNTLRIFTIIDREGVPHIGLPILRAGLGDSVTDNTSSGGLYFIVDKSEYNFYNIFVVYKGDYPWK